jgi:hypothetical protein
MPARSRPIDDEERAKAMNATFDRDGFPQAFAAS